MNHPYGWGRDGCVLFTCGSVMSTSSAFTPHDASLPEISKALAAKEVTSAELVNFYLERIARLDASGPMLNSMPLVNPKARDEAAQSDARRSRGEELGPLDGIPFAVKDNYRVSGMTVAGGSPAFAQLTATEDAFVVEQLRSQGAVLIGKTNMPPLADGGMQRGLYGRAESPYNPAFLAAAFGSGSSQGSAVAVAANLCAFALGSETVSSGRSPASNNSLVTYTPSRGLISLRGVWPLFALRDVVTPYTRSVTDLLLILDALMMPDTITRGDLWREQDVVDLPATPEDAPGSWAQLSGSGSLGGARIAVPRIYVGDGQDSGIEIRSSVLDRWNAAADHLRSLGAELVEVDFPLVEAYEGGRPAGENLAALGVLPDRWLDFEFNELLAFGWDDFLKGTQDPRYPGLANVDADRIFPTPPGALPDRYDEVDDYEGRYRTVVALAQAGLEQPAAYPDFAAGLRALERLRAELFENWLAEHEFDCVVFPANADVGPADADVNESSADLAWRNGVLFSNGNYAIRHLGIPTVTIPMGVMSDTDMPIGLTFAGAAYSDTNLLRYALDFEGDGSLRVAPPLP